MNASGLRRDSAPQSQGLRWERNRNKACLYRKSHGPFTHGEFRTFVSLSRVWVWLAGIKLKKRPSIAALLPHLESLFARSLLKFTFELISVLHENQTPCKHFLRGSVRRSSTIPGRPRTRHDRIVRPRWAGGLLAISSPQLSDIFIYYLVCDRIISPRRPDGIASLSRFPQLGRDGCLGQNRPPELLGF